jgi:hypothetical protein
VPKKRLILNFAIPEGITAISLQPLRDFFVQKVRCPRN